MENQENNITKIQETQENILPVSKRKYTVGKPLVKHMVNAERIGGSSKEKPFAFGCALVAQLVKLDGKKIVYEDVLSMDMEDLNVLSEAMGENFTASPPRE